MPAGRPKSTELPFAPIPSSIADDVRVHQLHDALIKRGVELSLWTSLRHPHIFPIEFHLFFARNPDLAGTLTHPSPSLIAHICRIDSHAAELLEALVDSGWFTRDPETGTLHWVDWEDRAANAVKERDYWAAKKRAQRQREKEKEASGRVSNNCPPGHHIDNRGTALIEDVYIGSKNTNVFLGATASAAPPPTKKSKSPKSTEPKKPRYRQATLDAAQRLLEGWLALSVEARVPEKATYWLANLLEPCATDDALALKVSEITELMEFVAADEWHRQANKQTLAYFLKDGVTFAKRWSDYQVSKAMAAKKQTANWPEFQQRQLTAAFSDDAIVTTGSFRDAPPQRLNHGQRAMAAIDNVVEEFNARVRGGRS